MDPVPIDRLLDLWERWRGGDPLPDRRRIEPGEIPPPLLPCVALLDVVDAATGNCRIRLAGDEVRRLNGVPLRGRTFADLESADRVAFTFADYARCAAEGRPVRGRGTLHYRGRRFIGFDRLLLPFRDAGPDVAVILAAFAYDERPAA